jgi:hypothetical protein
MSGPKESEQFQSQWTVDDPTDMRDAAVDVPDDARESYAARRSRSLSTGPVDLTITNITGVPAVSADTVYGMAMLYGLRPDAQGYVDMDEVRRRHKVKQIAESILAGSPLKTTLVRGSHAPLRHQSHAADGQYLLCCETAKSENLWILLERPFDMAICDFCGQLWAWSLNTIIGTVPWLYGSQT